MSIKLKILTKSPKLEKYWAEKGCFTSKILVRTERINWNC